MAEKRTHNIDRFLQLVVEVMMETTLFSGKAFSIEMVISTLMISSPMSSAVDVCDCSWINPENYDATATMHYVAIN
ncbi:MAG: hypothetical protein M2R45_03132 [Verrucomicrobia subdivision 3 bacterium]|nr:hypothetical protein [Limisphaerales bacterium]MCS1413200.1 hypothetical protein [Limisphaerales bacterium]